MDDFSRRGFTMVGNKDVAAPMGAELPSMPPSGEGSPFPKQQGVEQNVPNKPPDTIGTGSPDEINKQNTTRYGPGNI